MMTLKFVGVYATLQLRAFDFEFGAYSPYRCTECNCSWCDKYGVSGNSARSSICNRRDEHFVIDHDFELNSLDCTSGACSVEMNTLK